jgi:hypothetical protein
VQVNPEDDEAPDREGTDQDADQPKRCGISGCEKEAIPAVSDGAYKIRQVLERVGQKLSHG